MRRNKRCPLYPNSDRESRHLLGGMSALTPKADMCGATSDVCFGPRADIVIHSITASASRPAMQHQAEKRRL
jgi:hypothetical protein